MPCRIFQRPCYCDKLIADGGKDILAPVIHDVAISPQAIASPRDWLSGGVRFAGARVASATAGNGNGAVTNPGIGRIIDARNIQRPLQRGVSRGRFDGTKIPGSYSVNATAIGFSPTCGTRFVRHAMASVVVGETRGSE